MKKLSIILITISILASAVTVNAAPVPRESAPCNATEHQIIVVESYISGILDEVKTVWDMPMQELNQTAYSSMLGLADRQAVTATENLPLLQTMQYSNTEICI